MRNAERLEIDNVAAETKRPANITRRSIKLPSLILDPSQFHVARPFTAVERPRDPGPFDSSRSIAVGYA